MTRGKLDTIYPRALETSRVMFFLGLDKVGTD